MKKILALGIILAMVASLTIGCQPKKEEVKKEETKKEVLDYTIKFGTLPAESAIPIIIAKEQGFFEKEGVNVEVMPFFAPNDRNIAVQANKVDATIGDIMTSLAFHEAGLNMKITSDINEDFKLLTSPKSGIDTFEKLDGKDVSIVPNFVLEYIMDKMAEKNNIKYNVVTIPQFNARFEALLADKIDGVIFTEPQATLLASKGAYVLASSEEVGIKAGTLLFNEKTLNNNPEEVKAFYRAYNNAIEYINTADPSEYSEVLKEYGFPEGIDKYLANVEYNKAEEITNEGFNDVLKWTKSKGLVKNDYKLEDVSNFSFIK